MSKTTRRKSKEKLEQDKLRLQILLQIIEVSIENRDTRSRIRDFARGVLGFKAEKIRDLCIHPETGHTAYYTSNSDGKQGIRSSDFISCALSKTGQEIFYEIRWGEDIRNDLSGPCQDQITSRSMFEYHLSRLQELEQETSLSASAAVR